MRGISIFFTNWGGPSLFSSQLGEDHMSFGREKALHLKVDSVICEQTFPVFEKLKLVFLFALWRKRLNDI